MKTILTLTTILCCTTVASDAAAAPRDVATVIDAVTVFRSEAMVVRRARARIAPGTSRVRIPGLPARMRDDSVRVVMGGAARPLLIGFSVERLPQAERVSPEARALTAKRRTLERREAELRAADRRLGARRKFLRSLRSRFERKLLEKAPKTQLDTRTWGQAEAFLGAELGRVAAQRQGLRARRRVLRRRLRLVRRQLAQLRSKRAKLTKSLLVDVRSRAGGQAELEVRYQVPSVSWRSLYDARLEGRKVSLTHYALVVQQSGEDWDNVRLSVSTADTHRRISLPRLRAQNLRVSRYPGRVLRRTLRTVYKKRRIVRGESSGPADIPPPPAPEAEARRAEYVTTYTAATRVTIPSSPSGRKTPIAVLRFDSRLEHVSIPKRAQGAYLIAVGRLGRALPLPAGQVSLYFAGEYVGRTSLGQVVPGGRVRLPFGRDERVRVRRQLLLRKRHEQGVFTKEERWDYRYRIRVKNNSPRPVSVTVFDQIPNSQHEDIKVELAEDTTPRAPRRRRDAPGVLRWKLKLPPAQEQTIKLGFSVTFPRGKRVWGMP